MYLKFWKWEIDGKKISVTKNFDIWEEHHPTNHYNNDYIVARKDF